MIHASEQHFHTREYQEGAEDVKNPTELRNQRGAQAYHDGPQYNDPHDPPEQHSVLEFSGNGKKTENEGNNEHVVHGQRLLDQKASHIVHACVAAFLEIDPDSK